MQFFVKIEVFESAKLGGFGMPYFEYIIKLSKLYI